MISRVRSIEDIQGSLFFCWIFRQSRRFDFIKRTKLVPRTAFDRFEQIVISWCIVRRIWLKYWMKCERLCGFEWVGEGMGAGEWMNMNECTYVNERVNGWMLTSEWMLNGWMGEWLSMREWIWIYAVLWMSECVWKRGWVIGCKLVNGWAGWLHKQVK